MIYRVDRQTGKAVPVSGWFASSKPKPHPTSHSPSRGRGGRALMAVVAVVLLGWAAQAWYARMTPSAAPGPSSAEPPAASAGDVAAARAQRFTQWVAWRAQECRFLGPLEEGRFVCTNGRNYLGSVASDTAQSPPDTLPVALRGVTVGSLNAQTTPGPYRQFLPASAFAVDAWLAGDAEDAPSDSYDWYVGWMHWRAEHCTLHGQLQVAQGRYFACDDGHGYPTRYRANTVMGHGGHEAGEGPWAPLDWMLRYHKATFDAAPWEQKQWVIRHEVVPSTAPGNAFSPY